MHKKNGKDNYMKMIQVKGVLVIPNSSYEHFSEVMVNMNNLDNNAPQVILDITMPYTMHLSLCFNMSFTSQYTSPISEI